MIALKNNAQSVIALPIDAQQTTVNLSLGDGGRFPSLAYGDHFRAALKDSAGNLEFIACTARSGDILTVQRGQEGSSARAWAAGTRIQLRMTAKTWDEMASECWRRLVNVLGEPLLPVRVDAQTFTFAGDMSAIFEPSRSFRIFTRNDFYYAFVASRIYSNGETSVKVDGAALPTEIQCMDIGLPLNVHPKASNAAPVGHLIDPEAHADKFKELLELATKTNEKLTALYDKAVINSGS